AQSGSWTCTPSPNVGDKVDLVNAYALLYKVPANSATNANDNIFYAAIERSAPQGTANAGFWLLKDNTVGCTNGKFSGHHQTGDLLVVVTYTGGGQVTDVKGYEWRGGPHGCQSSNTTVTTAADCNDTPIFDGKDCKQPVAGGDSACGTTNGDPNACPGG